MICESEVFNWVSEAYSGACFQTVNPSTECFGDEILHHALEGKS